MSDEWATARDLDAPEFPLRPTGILDGRGRMIFSKAAVGFTRPAREYVVKDDEKIEEAEK